MEKIAYVYSFEASNWKSCQTITKYLITCYKDIFQNQTQKHFNLNSDKSIFDILNCAKDICDFNPTKIIFLDHKPHPLKIIQILNEQMDPKLFKNIEFIFLIFGDYTLYSHEWSEMGDYLHLLKVRFFCASDRQVKLVQSLLKNGDEIVSKFPFLVNDAEFYFPSKLRSETEKAFGFSSNDIILLYTGRLSHQKNVFQLINEFVVMAATDERLQLLIAGSFDDLGNPFTGISFYENEYYQKYLELRSIITPDINKRIHYLGNLNSEALNKLYNLADIYLSMSVHNDEDFGMSPAEAMSTGLPTILTDWAGYFSFHLNDPDNCILVPIKYFEKHIDFDRESFQKILKNVLDKIFHFKKNRIHISQRAIKYLGIKQNTNLLKTYLATTPPIYLGASEKFEILKQSFSKNPPFLDPETLTYSTQYFKIYECYLPEKL